MVDEIKEQPKPDGDVGVSQSTNPDLRNTRLNEQRRTKRVTSLSRRSRPR